MHVKKEEGRTHSTGNVESPRRGKEGYELKKVRKRGVRVKKKEENGEKDKVILDRVEKNLNRPTAKDTGRKREQDANEDHKV